MSILPQTKSKKGRPPTIRKSPFESFAANGRKPEARKKPEKKADWFDFDAVFGFGTDEE